MGKWRLMAKGTPVIEPSTELATLHTACVRLRDALSRWLDAFDALALDVGAAPRVIAAKPVHPTTLALLELAARADGVDSRGAADALQMKQPDAAGRLSRLHQDGRLTKRVVPGHSVRFFVDAAAADAWAAAAVPARLPPIARLAAMFEADAPAVAKALAVIAPQPAPSAPPPKPYIPPTPTRAARPPEPEVIEPEDVRKIVMPAPPGRFSVDPKTLGEDPESFSAQWARLRGKPEEACDS